MARRQQPNDTSTFKYYNANPKNRKTTDCVNRAVCTALNESYATVLREMCEVQIKTGYDNACNQGISKYMEEKGWVKKLQPRKADGTKYTGEEFCKILKKRPIALGIHPDFYSTERILANIGGHHIVAIVDGKVNDIWDSTGGCIGNIWVKPIR